MKSNIRIRFDLLKSKWLTLYQSPFLLGVGTTFSPKFWKGGDLKKQWEPGVSEHALATDICHRYFFFFVLKNFRRWRHKGGPVSHLSPSILERLFNFSVLKQVVFICTNIHNDWLKTWPDIRNLVFQLNEKLNRKFAAFWKFIIDDVTNKKNCHNWI